MSKHNAFNLDTYQATKTDINPLKRKRGDPSDLTQTTFCFNMLPPEILKLITSYLSPNANANLFQTLRFLHVVPTESNTNRTLALIMMFDSLITSVHEVISRAHSETIIEVLDDLGRSVEQGSLLLSGSTVIQVVSPENNVGLTDLDLYLKYGQMR